MDKIPTSLHKFTLQSHHLLDPSITHECSLVPDSPTVGNLSFSSDSLTVGGTNNFSADSTPSDTLQTESLRVAIIRNQLESQQLNGQAIVNFSQQRLAPTPTNKEYCKNQLRFLTWTQLNAAVPHGTFSGKDLANFLADMRHSYQLQVLWGN
ncbi:hypothetical protein PS15m_009744 [Mucor circinelloides]